MQYIKYKKHTTKPHDNLTRYSSYAVNIKSNHKRTCNMD